MAFDTAQKAFDAGFPDGVHKLRDEMATNGPRCMSAKGASTLFGYAFVLFTLSFVFSNFSPLSKRCVF